jgi:hypothetical protein
MAWDIALELSRTACDVVKATHMFRGKTRDNAAHTTDRFIDNRAMLFPEFQSRARVSRNESIGDIETKRLDQASLQWFGIVHRHRRQTVDDLRRGEFQPAQQSVLDLAGVAPCQAPRTSFFDLW